MSRDEYDGDFAGEVPRPGGGKPRVTIADIAREAGVSVPTVSKVLNRRAEVADETRRRVEQLIAKHNYARRPPRQRDRAGLVDLVFTDLDGPGVVDIIRAVEEIGQEKGLATVVTAARGARRASGHPWLDNLAARRSDGILLVMAEPRPQHLARLRAIGVPVVMVDPVGRPDDRTPSVGATDWSGAVQATDHLIGLGHRRIAHLAGPPELQCNRARQDGYRSALAAAGLPADDALTEEGDETTGSGERAALRLLARPDPPTAIFASGDAQALGALRAARTRGFGVPGDLSLVGFGDVPAARWSEPALTTIRQPLGEMAGMAMRMLLRHMESGQYGPTRIELATELVVRGTTGPPA